MAPPEDGNPPAPAYFELGIVQPVLDGSPRTRTAPEPCSPGRIYNLDGNRFVPGFDPSHLGGDVWSADAAIRVIENEPDWRGMSSASAGSTSWATCGGPRTRRPAPPGSVEEMRHLPFIAKTADRQVGRLIDALEAEGVLDETLVVITADHAAQTGRPFHGVLDDVRGRMQHQRLRSRTPPRPPPCARTATGTTGRTPTRSTWIRARRSGS